MRVFSAFTGVGGFELGLPKDWEVVGMSEVDRNANKVLRYRFGGVKNYGDIEKINYGEIPDFDVLVGGSPCQDLSVAGRRKGLVGDKSRLFYSYVSILKKKRPRYFIFENVAGLLSSNQGWDFAEVQNQFSEAGYGIWWQVLDATWFGIPQHRERVFVVGAVGGRPPIEVFFEPWHGESPPEIRWQSVNTITRRYKGGQSNGAYVVEGELKAQKGLSMLINSENQVNRVYNIDGIAPALHRKTGGSQVAKIAVPVLTPNRTEKRQNGRRFKNNGEPSFTLTATDRHGIYDGYWIRYLTPLEGERLMGWPDDWTRWGIDEDGNKVELSDNARYNLIGNGVVPQVVSAIINELIRHETHAHQQ